MAKKKRRREPLPELTPIKGLPSKSAARNLSSQMRHLR